ncbi:MAG: DUF373 family protein [Candidatus Altiarchaeota archaeon]
MKIVLCVDRDDDIGRKIKVKGPIIGIEENLKVATELALADPEDTDVNALFGAIKIAKEINAEVVTITGDINVGPTSDIKLSEQLDKIIEKFKPESVILVTDGAEDDEILPILQSRVKIDSKRTVIVRQSKELEKAYFTITHFIDEISEEPKLARLIFGIPGLVLILIAIGGFFGLINLALLTLLFFIGLYLVIKGSGFEEEFFSRISEFFKSISFEKISSLTYVLAFITLVVGLGYSYDEFSHKITLGIVDTFITILNLNSLNIVILAVIIAIIGRIIDDYATERYLAIRNSVIILAFIVIVSLLARSAADYWNRSATGDFIFWVVIGIVAFSVVIKLTEYVFIEEIETRKNLLSQYNNKKVFTVDGKELGKVSKVLLDGSKFIGIKVGKRKILKEELLPSKESDKIIVQS